MPRSVEPVPEFADEVLEEFRTPSTACVSGADFLLEELEEQDPDLSDRCGLLADRWEVYALSIPKCVHLMLLVSLDTRRKKPWPCVVHGLARSRMMPCEAGRHRAARHFGLINPSWEPANA